MRGWIWLALMLVVAYGQTPDRVQRQYKCAGGKAVTAVYFNQYDRVGIVYNQQTYGPLYQVMAASGVKYSNGRATWWTKGSGEAEEAFLMSEKSGQMLAEGCKPSR